MVQATLETLKIVGYADASARAIARVGGFNQALIFYHFGSVEDLLLASLQDFSERRLERYRDDLSGTRSLSTLVEVLTRLYEEDVKVGHIVAAQEIVAGCSSSTELGPRVVELLAPWMTFASELVQSLIQDTFLEGLVPEDEIGHAAVALYFGLETLAHLDRNRSMVRALLDRSSQLAPLMDTVLHADLQFGDAPEQV